VVRRLFSLNPSTGAIAGTPTATTCAGPGSCLYSFVGHVVDTIPNSADASCGITVVPATAAADVSIVKTGPAAVVASGKHHLYLTVTNAGPASAAAVTVTDILPAAPRMFQQRHRRRVVLLRHKHRHFFSGHYAFQRCGQFGHDSARRCGPERRISR